MTPAEELRAAATLLRDPNQKHVAPPLSEPLADAFDRAADAWEGCARRGDRRTDTSLGGRCLAAARAITGTAS